MATESHRCPWCKGLHLIGPACEEHIRDCKPRWDKREREKQRVDFMGPKSPEELDALTEEEVFSPFMED